MKKLIQALRRRSHRRQAVLRPGTAPLYPVPPRADVEAVREGLAALDSFAGSRGPTGLDEERPLFIAGVGWRVGSTLLQRLCCSDETAVVWGEVLGNMGVISRLSEAVCIARPGGWPFPDMWLHRSERREGRLRDDFIANLYPSAGYFREGLQQLVFAWLGAPARDRGYQRWGLKETRLSAADALFLRWLFPKSVFLPLVRHPFDAYQSCRAKGGDLWIEPRTNSPESFAEHWNRLAVSWVEAEPELSAPVIRYEDLVSKDFDFEALGERVGLRLRPTTVMGTRAGASSRKEEFPLDGKTRAVIRRIARRGMTAYGYDDGAG